MNFTKLVHGDISLEPALLHSDKKFINNPFLKNSDYQGIRAFDISQNDPEAHQFYFLLDNIVIGYLEFYVIPQHTLVSEIFVCFNTNINPFTIRSLIIQVCHLFKNAGYSTIKFSCVENTVTYKYINKIRHGLSIISLGYQQEAEFNLKQNRHLTKYFYKLVL